MTAKKPERVKVFFHRRGRDPESAWCTAVEQPHQYRLDNILFLHETPLYGDVIEARPSRTFDGALTCRRIVKPGGRFAMIVDYASVSQLGKLRAFLRETFDIVSEGCYGPRDGAPGRLYLAVPKRVSPSKVFGAARDKLPTLIAVHPAIKLKGAVAAAREPGAERKPPPTRKKRATVMSTLFNAVLTNDEAAFERITRRHVSARDEHGRSLLFMAVREGRTELVRRLIALGASVNPTRPKDLAPLLAAAMRNRPREAKILLEAGAKPELARDKDGDPVLVTAAFREATAVVRALCRVPHEPAHKSLALLEAAGVGNLEIVKLLIKHGAEPHWVSPSGNSAISIAKKLRRREVRAYLESL